MLRLWRGRPARPAVVAVLLFLLHGQHPVAAEPATAETTPPDAASAQRQACNRASFRMVIDVGHTREQPGATSAHGITEYDFNLRLGKVIERALRDAGFAKATLIVTGGPARQSLFQRVARASKLNAQAYLSIHHDSVPEQFKALWQEDGRVLSYCDRFSGHSIFISNDNGDRPGSLLFARLLGNRMKTHGLQYTPHYTEKFMGSRRRQLVDKEAGVYRYDQLIVLRKTRMPAALLEAGMIVNRTDDAVLADPERQQLIAASAVEAVDAFCAARGGQRPPEVASAARVERTSARTKKRAVRPVAMKREPDRKKLR